MKNYQEFRRVYTILRDEFMEHGNSKVEMHVKKEFYKKVGITDPQKIEQLEYSKSQEMHDRISLAVDLIEHYGSVYEIEEDVMRYITLNKPPQDKEIIEKLSLPFKSIFIETEITKEDADIGDLDSIHGILLYETSMAVHDEIDPDGYKNVGRLFMAYYLCFSADKFFIDEFKINVDKTDVKIIYDEKKVSKFLKDFICNFLLFINDPEIEFVTHARDEKNRERRIRQHKVPLPNSKRVRIIGRLKRYIDGISHNLSKGHFNYRFWISGHIRHLRSDKFVNKKGQIIFISPYVKGEGVLLKRTYDLAFEKDDDRKKDVENYELKKLLFEAEHNDQS
jgi:hypothetical protein